MRIVSFHAPREGSFVTVGAVMDAEWSVTLLLATYGVRLVSIHAVRGVVLLSARPTRDMVVGGGGESEHTQVSIDPSHRRESHVRARFTSRQQHRFVRLWQKHILSSLDSTEICLGKKCTGFDESRPCLM